MSSAAEPRVGLSGSGPEAGGFDQPYLIATSGEFTPLVALNNNATAGFDTDHASPHPAEGS